MLFFKIIICFNVRVHIFASHGVLVFPLF